MPWMPVWLVFCFTSIPDFRSIISSVLFALLARNSRSRLASMATWSSCPGLPLRFIVCTSSSSPAGAAAESTSAAAAASNRDFMRVSPWVWSTGRVDIASLPPGSRCYSANKAWRSRLKPSRLDGDGPGRWRRCRCRRMCCLTHLDYLVTGRDYHARKKHVCRQSTDHHDCQGLLHLRPRPDAQRQRDQAQDCRQACHQDRPEARPACQQQGWPQLHSLGAQVLNVFDQQDAVLHVQADE